MKLTKTKLKQIIKEELGNTLNEGFYDIDERLNVLNKTIQLIPQQVDNTVTSSLIIIKQILQSMKGSALRSRVHGGDFKP
jgi:hypothetical protein